MAWLMLVVGLLMLIAGADLLVRGAARLAGNLGVPALVIGLTVVAFGTSAPELAVSVRSAWAQQSEMAIANVVGSNIFNTLFILGLAALVSPLLVSRQLVRQDVPIMIGVSLLVLLLVMDGQLARWEAAVLFLLLLAYTLFLFFQGRGESSGAPEEELAALSPAPRSIWWNLAFLLIGLLLLVLGARWLVDGAVSIAASLGVSEAVIGLTIVAAGTSMPEVMTSVMATLRGERDIAIGNVVGSNVFNLLCVLGVSGLVSPEPLLAGAQMLAVDFPVMLAVAILCLPLFFVGGTLNRFEGGLFLLLYVSYVWYLIAQQLALGYLARLEGIILFGLVPATLIYVALCLLGDLLMRHREESSSE